MVVIRCALLRDAVGMGHTTWRLGQARVLEDFAQDVFAKREHRWRARCRGGIARFGWSHGCARNQPSRVESFFRQLFANQLGVSNFLHASVPGGAPCAGVFPLVSDVERALRTLHRSAEQRRAQAGESTRALLAARVPVD